MISRENFTEKNIRRLQDTNHRDPGLIERTIFAFGLLEALVKVGLNFVFKGGTSLMLLLPEPMRLSTDIDIVVDPDTDIEGYIDKARMVFPFIDAVEQIREKKGLIEKRHFKFQYDSLLEPGEHSYILLDVLYEENHYEHIVKREIKNRLIISEGENLTVAVPTADCILGDKLTAFAPHTTGIHFGKKNMEIMKQFYDVVTLIDVFEDFECVRKTFSAISRTEIEYRGINCSPDKSLLDTISAAICIGSLGKYLPEDFPNYMEGTRKVTNHIFKLGFNMDQASRMTPKVIYLAASILTNTPFEIITNIEDYKSEKLTQPDILMMKSFRKIDLTGFGYLIKADRLLKEYRCS